MKAARDQSDRNMNFDGMESMSPSRSSKHMTNTWSGHMNDGRLVQKAQAPNRTGNDGSCDTPRNLARSVTGASGRLGSPQTQIRSVWVNQVVQDMALCQKAPSQPQPQVRTT